MQTKQPTPRRLSALIAALAFGASASCFAAEAVEIEVPVMGSTTPTAASGISREQVRAELAEARDAGMLVRAGEAGDTAEVLAAREAFNVAQADAIMAEYRAEYERQVALAEAEVRRSEIEAEAAIQSMAGAPNTSADSESSAVDADLGAPGESLGEIPVDAIDSPSMQNSGGEESTGPGLRIDILDYQRTGVGRPEELVIVSMVGDDDETSQLERAQTVRSQLSAMGLAQDQIYIEAARA